MARKYTFYGIYSGKDSAVARARKINSKKYKVKIVNEPIRGTSGPLSNYFSIFRRRKR
jgi:hypothetical protein